MLGERERERESGCGVVAVVLSLSQLIAAIFVIVSTPISVRPANRRSSAQRKSGTSIAETFSIAITIAITTILAN